MSKGTSGSRSPVQSNYGDGHDNDAYNDKYVDENDKKDYDVADYDDGVLVPDDEDGDDVVLVMMLMTMLLMMMMMVVVVAVVMCVPQSMCEMRGC